MRDAIGLLTRLPMGGAASSEPALGGAVPFLPVVGAALGVVIAAVYATGSSVLPDLVAATVAIGTGMLLTGALHEDGLADMVDALGAGGPEEALRIMDDPVHGTFGVLALVVTSVIRISALAALSDASALAVLVGAHSLARASSAWGLRLPAAKTRGSGASFVEATGAGSVSSAFAIATVVGAVALGVWVIPALVACIACSWAVYAAARKRFGGITGDVLGAAEQLSELAVLLIGAAAMARGWSGLPWWR